MLEKTDFPKLCRHSASTVPAQFVKVCAPGPLGAPVIITFVYSLRAKKKFGNVRERSSCLLLLADWLRPTAPGPGALPRFQAGARAAATGGTSVPSSLLRWREAGGRMK